jgi:anti-anti-sigma regulatory factor
VVTKQPMDVFFKPEPGAWPENKLRVAPDLLPAGSVELAEVWIDDKSYTNFDRQKLVVNLPDSDRALRVRVRIEPAGCGFSADLISFDDGISVFALDGDLTSYTLPAFKKELEKLNNIKGIVLDMTDLKSVDDTAWNYLLFTAQQRGADFSIKLKGLNEAVAGSLKDAELDEEFAVIA